MASHAASHATTRSSTALIAWTKARRGVSTVRSARCGVSSGNGDGARSSGTKVGPDASHNVPGLGLQHTTALSLSPGSNSKLPSSSGSPSKAAPRRAISADWRTTSSMDMDVDVDVDVDVSGSWENDVKPNDGEGTAQRQRLQQRHRQATAADGAVKTEPSSSSEPLGGHRNATTANAARKQASFFSSSARARGGQLSTPGTETGTETGTRTETGKGRDPRAGLGDDTSSSGGGIAAGDVAGGGDGATELVMVLERRGEGWAEEVLPHVALRRRPIPVSPRAEAKRMRDLSPDSAQTFLTENVGFTRDEAASVVSAAAAWRVTRGGRALVDRKLMRVVQDNAPAVVAALRHLGASAADVAALLRGTPQVLAVVPNSEWNRNLLEYVVRTKVPGGGRFGPLELKHLRRARPSKVEVAAMKRRTRKNGGDVRAIRAGVDPMKPWVEDVRLKRADGKLTQEQLYMIDVAGFDADVKEKSGGESRRTWEKWFDELVEYQCASGTCEVPEERDGAGLGLWLRRQKQKHRDGVLPERARRRLAAMGVSFEGFEVDSAGLEAVASADAAVAESKSESASAEGDSDGEGDAEARSTSSAPASGTSRERAAWEQGLDRGAVEMVHSLRAFTAQEGPCAEPPLGSQLAVWLAHVRSRAAAAEGGEADAMPPDERAALTAAGVELENFSAAWLGELQRYSSLRQHRGTLHAPAAMSCWVRQQRAAAAAGKLSRAQLRRLRAAGMSGLAGALMLDDGVMEVVEVLVDPTATEDALRALGESRRDPRPVHIHHFPGDAMQQLSAMSLRENVAAADAAAAARAEAAAEAAAEAEAEAGARRDAQGNVDASLAADSRNVVRKVPARAAGRAPRCTRNRQVAVRVKPSVRAGAPETEELGAGDASEGLVRVNVPQESKVESSSERTLEYMRSQGF